MRGRFIQVPREHFFVIVIFCAFATTCKKDRVIYSESHQTDPAGWTYSDSVVFQFKINDITEKYNLQLEICHLPDFQYQNLYTRIQTAFPTDSVKTDILSLELADKTGQWYGRCTKKECRLIIPLQTDVTFRETGQYALSFAQHTREETLRGIQSLGLLIKEGER